MHLIAICQLTQNCLKLKYLKQFNPEVFKDESSSSIGKKSFSSIRSYMETKLKENTWFRDNYFNNFKRKNK